MTARLAFVMTVFRRLIAALGFYVVLDLAAAALLSRLSPGWNPAAVEASYRIPARYYHHGLVPNAVVEATGWYPPYPYRTNSLGLRDAWPRQVPLCASGWRVLLLGDSFTEGLGVAYEATYVGVLADSIRASGAEALNGAVSSYAPVLYQRKAEWLLDSVGLAVDAIIVGIDISDPYDEVRRYRQVDGGIVMQEVDRTKLAAFLEWPERHSLLGHLVVSRLIPLGWDPPDPLGLGQYKASWTFNDDALTDYGIQGLMRAEEHMDSLAALARRHRAALGIFVYPWPDQILRRDSGGRQAAFWGAWALARGVAFANLFPAFLGPDSIAAIRRVSLPRDAHWSVAGHRLVADTLWRSPLSTLLTGQKERVSEALHPRPPGR